jgi:hypothetical protein
VFAHLEADRAGPQLKLLDRLFPRVATAAPPVAKPKFTDWLPPKPKASGRSRKAR